MNDLLGPKLIKTAPKSVDKQQKFKELKEIPGKRFKISFLQFSGAPQRVLSNFLRQQHRVFDLIDDLLDPTFHKTAPKSRCKPIFT